MDRGVRRDPVPEDQRRLGLGPAPNRLELLDSGGHPAERLRHVGPGRRGSSLVAIKEAEGVQVAGVDGGQRGLELLDR